MNPNFPDGLLSQLSRTDTAPAYLPWHLARIQLSGNCVLARMPSFLYLANDRQHVPGKLRRPRLEGHAHAGDRADRIRSAKLRAMRLGRC